MIELCVLAGVVVAVGSQYGAIPVLALCVAAGLASSSRTAAAAGALAQGLALVVAMFWGTNLLLASTLGGEPPALRVAASVALLVGSWLPRLRADTGRWPALLGLLAFAIIALDTSESADVLLALPPEAQEAELGVALSVIAAVGLEPLDDADN